MPVDEIGGSLVTYGFATGAFGTLPKRIYENEAGIDIETISNQLGHPLSETVTAWGTIGSPTGASRVERTYGSSTGCGCVASGSPTRVVTLDDADEVLTAVERVYDPRGSIIEEKLTVHRPVVDPVEMVTAMEYDAVGRRTRIEYPERPHPDPRSIVMAEYRMDGLARALVLEEAVQQTPIEIASYRYDGQREILRKHHAVSTSNDDWIAETVTTYDALGRVAGKSYALNDESGCDMGFIPSFATTVEGRTIDGAITALIQIPRSASETGTELTASYEGAGSLATQSYPFADGQNSETLTTTYTRDALELLSVEDDWANIVTNPLCAAAPAFEYTRTIERTANQLRIDGLRPTSPASFFAQNDEDGYLERAWYDHRSTRSTLGWTTETVDYYFDRGWCGCDSQSAGPALERRDYYEIRRTFERDAWGRTVEEGYSRTWLDDDESDSTTIIEDGRIIGCDQGGLWVDVHDDEEEWTETWPTEESMVDGFGRLVFSIRPMAPDDLSNEPTVSFPIGLYHAYADGTIIQSRGCGDDGADEPESHFSHIEYYNHPGTGQADKVHLNRDASHPSPSNPSNPWNNGTDPDITGATFATPLYDARGHLALMNGLPPSGGMGCTGEGAFTATARAFDMTGADIEPAEGQPVDYESFACGLGFGMGIWWNFQLPEETDERLGVGNGQLSAPVLDPPTCGVDATENLKRMGNNLETEFVAKSRKEKRDACRWLILRGAGTAGWDTRYWWATESKREMFESKGGVGPCGKGNKGACSETLTISGKCYLAEEVNYWLFGFAYRLCAGRKIADGDIGKVDSERWEQLETDAVNLVKMYRNLLAGLKEAAGGDVDPEREQRMKQTRVAWTRARYHKRYEAPEVEIPGCAPCKDSWWNPGNHMRMHNIYWYDR